MENILRICKQGSAEFFVLYVVENEECVITGYGIDLHDCKREVIFPKVVIPDEINGLKVTQLNSYRRSSLEMMAYLNLSKMSVQLSYEDFPYISISELWLPSTVNDITAESFLNSRYVKSIVWPEACKTIPYQCFKNSSVCGITFTGPISHISTRAFLKSNLMNIDIPYGCKIIDVEAFAECEYLSKITIPNSVRQIRPGAFFKTHLSEITWPAKCNTIPDNCFKDCRSLKTVYITGDIKCIEPRAFYRCQVETLDMSQILSVCEVEEGFFKIIQMFPDVKMPFYGTLTPRKE